MAHHIRPNVMGPVLVIATINLALAVITEATLCFLGSGVPETMPSLGTLIRIGNKYLFSGEWWIVAFPGIALAAARAAVNLLGDWLRDALESPASVIVRRESGHKSALPAWWGERSSPRILTSTRLRN